MGFRFRAIESASQNAILAAEVPNGKAWRGSLWLALAVGSVALEIYMVVGQ